MKTCCRIQAGRLYKINTCSAKRWLLGDAYSHAVVLRDVAVYGYARSTIEYCMLEFARHLFLEHHSAILMISDSSKG